MFLLYYLSWWSLGGENPLCTARNHTHGLHLQDGSLRLEIIQQLAVSFVLCNMMIYMYFYQFKYNVRYIFNPIYLFLLE